MSRTYGHLKRFRGAKKELKKASREYLRASNRELIHRGLFKRSWEDIPWLHKRRYLVCYWAFF